MVDRKLRVIFCPNEMSFGGVSVYNAELSVQFTKMGHTVLLVTYVPAFWSEWAESEGIEVKVIKHENELYDVAKEFKPDIMFGNSCGGGSFICKIGRDLGIVSGEGIHSLVGGSNEYADFEISTSKVLESMRPKCVGIYNGFNPDRLRITISKEEMRKQIGIPEDAFVIGRHGRITGSKLPEHFVYCLHKLPGIYGILSGIGDEEDNLKKLSYQLGLNNRLFFTGPTYEIGNIDNAMDVFVYPTLDELACMSVSEAILNNIPVVCYIRGGMGELLIHNETCFVANSPDELAHWVNHIRNNPEEGKRIAGNAKNLAVSRGMHDIRRFAQDHLEVFYKALERKDK